MLLNKPRDFIDNDQFYNKIKNITSYNIDFIRASWISNQI